MQNLEAKRYNLRFEIRRRVAIFIFEEHNTTELLLLMNQKIYQSKLLFSLCIDFEVNLSNLIYKAMRERHPIYK